MKVSLATLAERPDLFESFIELDEQWPSFMLQDPLGLLLGRLGLAFVDSAFVVLDDHGSVVGRAISVPVHWSINEELPQRGWDAAIEAAIECALLNLEPRCMCALEITLHRHAKGLGLGSEILDSLRQIATTRSFEGLLAPVRPTRLGLSGADNPPSSLQDHSDPWLDAHKSLGAEVASVARLSMSISGTFEQWTEWTGTSPSTVSGDTMEVPGGLAPVLLDHNNQIGSYIEANIWCKHRLGVALDDPTVDARGIDLRPYDSIAVPPEVPPGWSVVTATGDLISQAEMLEYEIFLEAGFCDANELSRVREFEPWRDSSEFVVVLSPEQTVEGAVRILVGDFDQLPVGKFERTEMYPPDPVMEYASLSVRPDCRKTGVTDWLNRAVGQRVLRRGCGGIVAIGEEWLLNLINDSYGFEFEPLGPSVWYMGGECFAMGTDIATLMDRLKRQPSIFRWILSEIDLRDLPRADVRGAATTARSA